MACFCCFDFAKEIHLLSNQKVFARVFQAKTFLLGKEGVSTSLHLGRRLSPERRAVLWPVVEGRLLSSAKELFSGGESNYSLASIDWARLASILMPGPIVVVMVMCLM